MITAGFVRRVALSIFVKNQLCGVRYKKITKRNTASWGQVQKNHKKITKKNLTKKKKQKKSLRK